MHALRAALAGLIDYAGLFPPASLALPRVVANHQRYVLDENAWLLGRLILPVGLLGEAEPLLEAGGGRTPWTISVLARTAEDLDRLLPALERFNDPSRAAAVVAVELAASSAGEIRQMAKSVPERYERYVEVPPDDRLPELLDTLAASGCYAKVRTGGVSADAFPDAAALSRFIAACVAREVPFKATAGLHHPIRGSYRLTYEPQSPAATMHGFVNLVVAAGLLAHDRIDERAAAAILETTDPQAFSMEPAAIGWGPHRLDLEACVRTRAHLLRSVGSCSFEEPLHELTRLGWV